MESFFDKTCILAINEVPFTIFSLFILKIAYASPPLGCVNNEVPFTIIVAGSF
jgi:hypothetical protein